ncbi:related to Heme-binding protein HMX1 [Nakaseomyces glabratus]|nr:Heme oxygenase [Nakaseomyces glabratus]QNG12270.1 HMX1 [Nakaseomyces glabratus]SCV16975.1 related to Heme-binding protein HMX1 [Nakaseomyces glabratus]SLM16773.1 related to Heme-binding protein HMX1 [Nakaseomyces glabratus]
MSVPAPTDIGALANRINFNTRDAHNKIDAFMSVRFAVALRHGKLYRQGILAFYYVFQAIEQEIDALLSIDTATGTGTGATDVSDQKLLASKIVKQFWMPEFRRTEQLYKDLLLLYSPEYPTSTELDAMLVDHQLPPQLQGFVDMVHATVRQNPVTVLAYCHVMYLALFAGGKVMRSTLYRNTGLFPKFEHLSSKELARKGTNFFTFSDAGVDVENQMKWQYKKNYELATREALAENDKLEIIDVAKRIFERNMDIIQEIGQLNKEALTNNKLDLLQYVFEELKFYNKDRSHQQLVYAVLVLLALLVLYRIVYR